MEGRLVKDQASAECVLAAYQRRRRTKRMFRVPRTGAGGNECNTTIFYERYKIDKKQKDLAKKINQL